MAHLHRCSICGRQFRCEAVAHPRPAWYWCDFRCPDRTHHGFGLYHVMDAEFLRYCDTMCEFEDHDLVVEVKPVPIRRSLRCQAQGQRTQRGS